MELKSALEQLPFIKKVEAVDTNIVIFNLLDTTKEAAFMNKLQVIPSLTAFEQWQRYCLMHNASGYTYVNSPTKVSIRILNVDKIELENTQCILRVPLLIGTVNVGSTLSSHHNGRRM